MRLADDQLYWRVLQIAVPVLAAFLFVTLQMLTTEIPVPEIRYLAWLLALIPPAVYVPLVLWLGRYEMEPRWLLSVLFVWGAAGATVISAIINGFAGALYGPQVAAIVSAPMVEELSKGLALFLLVRYEPDEFNGILDGIVYATMVALGFAMAENVLYFGRAALGVRDGPLGGVFLARGIFSPLSHPLFTSMTGVGLGLAVQAKRSLMRAACAGSGLLTAMFLHSTWNSSIFTREFAQLYVEFFAPGLLVLIVIAILGRRRERRILVEELAPEVKSGIITAREYSELISPSLRRARLRQALRKHGLAHWALLFRLYELAIRLAILKGQCTSEAEAQMSPDIQAHRAAISLVRAKMLHGV